MKKIKEMSFKDAVPQARKVAGNNTIVSLTLHPDGLWTVRWFTADPCIQFEEKLSVPEKEPFSWTE